MSNIVDRFSTHLREVLVRSIRLATELKSESVEPMHLFFALSLQKGSVANEILNRYKVTPKNIEKVMIDSEVNFETITNILNEPGRDQMTLSPFSPSSKVALEKAMLVAEENGHNYVGTEHLLSSLIHLNDPQLELFFKKNNLKISEIEGQLESILANVSQFSEINDAPEIMDRLQESLGEDIVPFTNNTNKNKKKEMMLEFLPPILPVRTSNPTLTRSSAGKRK